MEQVAVGYFVLELTDSAWLVALVGFWRNAPLLVLGLVGGELADRFDRRSVLIAAQLANLLATAFQLVQLLRGVLTYEQIVLAQVVLGISWAIDWPSRRSSMMDIVGQQRIVQAALLDSTSMNISRIFGPLSAGGLLYAVGVQGSYALLLVCYTASMLALTRLRLPAPERREGGAILHNLIAGLRHCRENGSIMGVLSITTAMNMLAFPYQQLLPVFARDVLGVGPVGLGLLAAGDGIGSLIAGLTLGSLGERRRRPGPFFIYGSLAMCAALVVFTASSNFMVSMAALTAFGLAHASFSAFQSSIILMSTAAEWRGRAMGALTIAIGTSPLGALELGLLAGLLGAPIAVATTAAAAFVWVAWAGRAYPSLRRA